MADQIDMRRHHQNNLDHARQVFLSILFSAPKDMWFDEIEKLTHAMVGKLEDGKKVT